MSEDSKQRSLADRTKNTAKNGLGVLQDTVDILGDATVKAADRVSGKTSNVISRISNKID